MVTAPDGQTVTVPGWMRTFPNSTTGLPYYQFQADIVNLNPGTQYGYRVTHNGASLAAGPNTFRTAAGGDVSFLVFGDSGENTPEQKALINRMAAEPDIAFLMHTGDLAYPMATGALLDSNYFALNAPLFERLPVFPTPGNHDYLASMAAPYLAAHSLPSAGVDPDDAGRYYSFEWGEAHFTSIDSNLLCGASEERMLAWLENDLAAARQFWKIVFFHHPPYPTGHHRGDVVCAAALERVTPILERNGVQLVLSGHEHGYERTVPTVANNAVLPGEGTVYVITGGGGAGLHDMRSGGLTEIAVETHHFLRIDVRGGSLTIRAVGLDGREIESYTLRPKPVLPENAVLSLGDYTAAVAPGSLVGIFGRNLGVAPEAAAGQPLPVELGGVRALLNGNEIPLIYVSPGQVNAHIPLDAPFPATLEIVTANGRARQELKLQPVAPSIMAVTTRNAPVTADNMAETGGAVVVYATGLGPCQRAGAGASATLRPTVASIDVWLGETLIQPAYSGLTPDFTGVYQVNFVVPPALPGGNYLLRIARSDVTSRAVPLLLRQSNSPLDRI